MISDGLGADMSQTGKRCTECGAREGMDKHCTVLIHLEDYPHQIILKNKPILTKKPTTNQQNCNVHSESIDCFSLATDCLIKLSLSVILLVLIFVTHNKNMDIRSILK